MVKQLLSILSRRPSHQLQVFYNALDETNQEHITGVLRDNVLQQQQQQQQQQQGEHAF